MSLLPRTALVTVMLVTAGSIAAQEFGGRRGGRRDREGVDAFTGNTAYDGRFTFARIRFEPLGSEWGRGRDLKWDHDFPRAERNLMKIVKELSSLDPFMEGGNVFRADDPELHRFPVAYVSEPGFWTVSDKEAEGLRSYLLKGGFLIFDDFFGEHWFNFESQMLKVLPRHAWFGSTRRTRSSIRSFTSRRSTIATPTSDTHRSSTESSRTTIRRSD
jgi:hypothetical protein